MSKLPYSNIHSQAENYDLPPALVETEAEALSCLIREPASWGLSWNESHFITGLHRKIFAELEAHFQKDGAVPPLEVLTETLAKRQVIDGAKLTEIVFACDLPTAFEAANLHRALSRNAQKRQTAVALLGGLRDLDVEEPLAIARRIADGVERFATVNARPPFVDLGAILAAGDIERMRPTVARVTEHKPLFYAGRLNELHAEPGAGKSNILIHAACLEAAAGNSVIYIDPEDDPNGFIARCIGLGAAPATVAKVKYLHDPTPEEVRAAQAWTKANPVSLVCLDGLAESLTAEGKDENNVGDILSFFRFTLRPFADAGAAVAIADHVTKSTENRGWARGSGAKNGRYNGLVLEVETIREYTPDVAGAVRLRISKDRCGGAGPKGSVYLEAHFTPGVEHTHIEFREPLPAGEWKPTEIMQKVVKHLERNGRSTKNQIAAAVGGKKEYVFKAVECLVDENKVAVEATKKGHFVSLLNHENEA